MVNLVFNAGYDRSELERAKFNLDTVSGKVSVAVSRTTPDVEVNSLVAVTSAPTTGTGGTLRGYVEAAVVINAASVTTGGTLQVEGSIDNTNWMRIPLDTLAVQTGLAIANNIITISATGVYQVPLKGIFGYARVKLLTRTDGTYTADVVVR